MTSSPTHTTDPSPSAAQEAPALDLRSKETATAPSDDPKPDIDITTIPPWNNAQPILTIPHPTLHQLTLRHFLATDAPVLATLCNNPKLAINMRDTFPQPYTLSDAHTWIRLCNEPNPANWAPSGPATHDPTSSGADTTWTGPLIPTKYQICLSDVPIGGIGLNFGTDIKRRTAELGYWVGEEYWGRGVMTVAVRAFVDWAFETFDLLVRIEAGILGWNPGSWEVLRKCGFVEEGVMRCGVWKKGRLVDLRAWARVREGCVGETVLPVLVEEGVRNTGPGKEQGQRV